MLAPTESSAVGSHQAPLLETPDRVKALDMHDSEPWVCAALYSGCVMIIESECGSLVNSFPVSELPVRCVKFIERKEWFVTVSDDFNLRIFDYRTEEKIKEFKAHSDYIRSIDVHPTLPYILSSSDDLTIKLWAWNRDFLCLQTFPGHSHYVMQIKFNPNCHQDNATGAFVSASLDRTIKVWGLGSHGPHYTLEGHERGVNCIEYYHPAVLNAIAPSVDKTYIVSGSDDLTVKMWDCQTQSLLHSFTGHTNNVTSVVFHSNLRMIVSASEDGTVRTWKSNAFFSPGDQQVTTTAWSYGNRERSWALAVPASADVSSRKLFVGCDYGCVCLDPGATSHEEDTNTRS